MYIIVAHCIISNKTFCFVYHNEKSFNSALSYYRDNHFWFIKTNVPNIDNVYID